MKTFGLKPKQLANLLGIGWNDDPVERELVSVSEKQKLLEEIFKATLPLGIDVDDMSNCDFEFSKGELEFLKNNIIHPAARLDQGRSQNGQRAAVFVVAGPAEYLLR